MKLECDTNGLHERGVLWPLHFFMKRPAIATLSARIALRSKSLGRQKNSKVTTYCGAGNYILKTYATGDVVAETVADLMHFTQPWNKSPLENSEALWNKALLRDRVYDEYVWNSIFIESLSESIRHTMRCYQVSKKNATVHDLERQTMSLMKLQPWVAQY